MLIPEVLQLFHEGVIHLFDAEWIGRLKPESQLKAAVKCMAANPTFGESRPKSSITHGSPSTQARKR